jgi:hypothetical protein
MVYILMRFKIIVSGLQIGGRALLNPLLYSRHVILPAQRNGSRHEIAIVPVPVDVCVFAYSHEKAEHITLITVGGKLYIEYINTDIQLIIVIYEFDQSSNVSSLYYK